MNEYYDENEEEFYEGYFFNEETIDLNEFISCLDTAASNIPEEFTPKIKFEHHLDDEKRIFTILKVFYEKP